MTARKPRIDPAKLKPIPARRRLVLDTPVRIVRKPDADEPDHTSAS